MKQLLCIKLIHCGNKNLTNPNDNLEKFVFFMPMGIFSLAGILKQNGFDVEIIHLDLESEKEIQEILDFDSLDAVGFGCHWANQSRVVLDMCHLLKKIKPELFIFLGGYTANYFAREILEEYPSIDAVIQGDAEIPLLKLCKSLQNRPGSDLNNVPNLVWRNEYNQVVINELTYVSSALELDQFDFSAIELLRNWKSYQKISKYWTRFKSINQYPMFFVEVGRGCKYNCTYCGGNAAAQSCLNGRKGQAKRSIESIIISIKKAMSFGYRCFFVCFEYDDSDQWYIRLFQRIKEENLNISFAYESWSLPSKDLVDIMSECCERVMYTISPDNGDQEVRRRNKDIRLFYSNQELEECLDHISTKHNVNVQLYFGYFIPFETSESIYKTMDLITKLFYKYSDFTEVVYMSFNTDPCSSLYLKPKKYDFQVAVKYFSDFVEKMKLNYEMQDGKVPGMTLLSWPNSMTELDAVNLANKINLFNNLFYFRKSILELFSRKQNLDLFSNYFRSIDLSFVSSKDGLGLLRVKQILINICQQENVLDHKLSQMIEDETRHLRTQSLIDNLTHVYTVDRRKKVDMLKHSFHHGYSLMENKYAEDGDFGF